LHKLHKKWTTVEIYFLHVPTDPDCITRWKLDVKLGEGMVQLHDLELNTEAVNFMLEKAESPVRIASGSL
jgi:hypothetical protein